MNFILNLNYPELNQKNLKKIVLYAKKNILKEDEKEENINIKQKLLNQAVNLEQNSVFPLIFVLKNYCLVELSKKDAFSNAP